MPAPLQRWTRARVLALPHDGARRELVDGALLVTPAPRPRHEYARELLRDRLAGYCRTHGIGLASLMTADLRFEREQVLQPDLMVLPPDWRPSESWDEPVRLLLVVEVVSPTSARFDRHEKRRAYLRGGVPEYWVVDVDERAVERWRQGDEQPELMRSSLRWQPRADVPALELDLVVLFDEVWEGRR